MQICFSIISHPADNAILGRCIEKLCLPRFICYTFLINDNIFDIPDVNLINYLFKNYESSIKNITYFHDYNLNYC